MTKTDAKRILRAYRNYARQADKRHDAQGADFDLALAAHWAQRSLNDLLMPALKACNITRDGVVLELIDEALAA